MTSRKELESLQIKARKAGRVANFLFDGCGNLEAVAYLDPKGSGQEKVGIIIDLLTFAEKERAK